jgi:phosphatidylserine/phosphatidylglycerophosphate/cardiolipin synthase-like enzyme
MSVTHRQFLHTSGRSRNDVRELLQAIFVAEFLAPSDQLWLVSPWISDVEVIDDRSGSFRLINRDSKRQSLRLAQVLARLSDEGTSVIIVTRPDASRGFVEALGLLISGGPGAERVTIVERMNLHAKGLVGDDYCLSGSMNFTYSGLHRWEEMLSFHTNPADVARLRHEFESEYGGGA